MSLSFAEDADHAFFKIVTKADVDLSAGSGSTFGVLVNDISNTGQINELVCGTYTTSGGSERGYTYQWDEVWVVQDGGSDREPNIRVNNGFSGLELAFLSDYDLNIIKQDNHNFSLVFRFFFMFVRKKMWNLKTRKKSMVCSVHKSTHRQFGKIQTNF